MRPNVLVDKFAEFFNAEGGIISPHSPHLDGFRLFDSVDVNDIKFPEQPLFKLHEQSAVDDFVFIDSLHQYFTEVGKFFLKESGNPLDPTLPQWIKDQLPFRFEDIESQDAQCKNQLQKINTDNWLVKQVEAIQSKNAAESKKFAIILAIYSSYLMASSRHISYKMKRFPPLVRDRIQLVNDLINYIMNKHLRSTEEFLKFFTLQVMPCSPDNKHRIFYQSAFEKICAGLPGQAHGKNNFFEWFPRTVIEKKLKKLQHIVKAYLDDVAREHKNYLGYQQSCGWGFRWPLYKRERKDVRIAFEMKDHIEKGLKGGAATAEQSVEALKQVFRLKNEIQGNVVLRLILGIESSTLYRKVHAELPTIKYFLDMPAVPAQAVPVQSSKSSGLPVTTAAVVAAQGNLEEKAENQQNAAATTTVPVIATSGPASPGVVNATAVSDGVKTRSLSVTTDSESEVEHANGTEAYNEYINSVGIYAQRTSPHQLSRLVGPVANLALNANNFFWQLNLPAGILSVKALQKKVHFQHNSNSLQGSQLVPSPTA